MNEHWRVKIKIPLIESNGGGGDFCKSISHESIDASVHFTIAQYANNTIKME